MFVSLYYLIWCDECYDLTTDAATSRRDNVQNGHHAMNACCVERSRPLICLPPYIRYSAYFLTATSGDE